MKEFDKKEGILDLRKLNSIAESFLQKKINDHEYRHN